MVPGPILLTIAVAMTAAGMDLTYDLAYVSKIHLYLPETMFFRYLLVWIRSSCSLKRSSFQDLAPNYGNSINTVIKIIGNTPGILMCYLVGFVTRRYNVSYLLVTDT